MHAYTCDLCLPTTTAQTQAGSYFSAIHMQLMNPLSWQTPIAHMSPVSEAPEGFPLLEGQRPDSYVQPLLLIQWFSTTGGALKDKQA